MKKKVEIFVIIIFFLSSRARAQGCWILGSLDFDKSWDTDLWVLGFLDSRALGVSRSAWDFFSQVSESFATQTFRSFFLFLPLLNFFHFFFLVYDAARAHILIMSRYNVTREKLVKCVSACCINHQRQVQPPERREREMCNRSILFATRSADDIQGIFSDLTNICLDDIYIYIYIHNALSLSLYIPP